MNTYRLQSGTARRWFNTYDEAKKAQKKFGGYISMLAPGAEGTQPWDWIEL